ncbi:MAG: peptide chain release factor N(5)-glutamine methyltransferase [Thermoguttaceae bacterium]
MPETWTVKRLLEWTTDFLTKSGRASPRLDAEILLAAALGFKRIELYTNFETEPPKEKRAVFRDYVKRRAAGEPVAYLVGHKEFYSLKFVVDSSTLVPRPETELLVVEAIDFLKRRKSEKPGQPLKICDVGTGSGAIAVTIAKHVPDCTVIAIDVSDAALEIAKRNAESHEVSNKITWLKSDLFAEIQPGSNANSSSSGGNSADEACESGNLFDIIVSNPPYISQAEYDELDPEVKNFEPLTALLAGNNGTEIIERLILQAYACLKPGGAIMIEVSPMIADKVAEFFHGDKWKDVRTIKDLANLERIVAARKA